MTFIQQLMQRLEAASGDTRAQAAVAAEFVLMARTEPEREPLRSALDAAAVLRWFDASLMKKVLEIPGDEARKRFEELKALPFVERYRRGEHDLCNVHESTRLGWRKQLAHEWPERFADLSARAAACFADDFTPAGRIDWIYHLLCGDPKRGVTELESLDRNWGSRARPEDRYALASALMELEDTRLVQGGARVWVLLATAWTRISRDEAAQLADNAGKILDLARASADPRAEADAQCLLGDMLQAQGKLEAAHAAFEEYLAISRHLAEQDPSNAGWQQDLAVAHRRVGDVLQAQGKLEAAHAAFGEYLAISRRLAEQDPSNADWQRELAVACWRIAHLWARAGRHAAALPLYEEASRIFGVLAERASGFVQWAKEKENVESELSSCSLLALVSKKEDPYTLAILDSNPDVRQAAVQKLVRGWKEDPDTLAILERRAASAASAASYILAILKQRAASNNNSSVRQAAVRELADGWKEDPDILAWLKLRAIFDEDWAVRQAAERALADGWKEDPDTLAILQQHATSDSNPAVRQTAVQELARGWKEDPNTLAILKRAISDNNSEVRQAAVQELAHGWKWDPDTLVILKRATSDSNPAVRHVAVQALARAGRGTR